MLYNHPPYHHRSRKLRVIGTLVMTACLSGLLGFALGQTDFANRHQIFTSVSPSGSMRPVLNTERVLVVGGSMAHGWKDAHKNSYIRRAFTDLSSTTNSQYTYIDRTMVGTTATSMHHNKPYQFAKWLKQARPQIVVISWGLLDDIYDKTKTSDFKQSISTEIQKSLRAKAIVILVSPPVVRALATYDQGVAEKMIAEEFDAAGQFDSPRVYTFDVFNQMEAYMKARGQTYKMYYGDNWHPNSAGHELSGKILYNDLIQTFGQAPI